MAKKFPKQSFQNQNLTSSPNQSQLLISQSKANWWQKLSIAWKTIILAIAIGTVPVAMVGFLSHRLAKKSVNEQVVKIRENVAVDLQNEINLFMLERFKDIQIMAHLDIFTDEQIRNQISNQAKAASLSQIQSISGNYNNIVVFDAQGKIIAQTRANQSTELLGKQHIQSVIESNQVVISEPILSRKTGTYSIYLAAPVKDKETGRSIAYISSRIPFAAFQELLSDFRGEGNYYLIDNRGKILLSSAENDLLQIISKTQSSEENGSQEYQELNVSEVFSGVNSLLSEGLLSSTDQAIKFGNMLTKELKDKFNISPKDQRAIRVRNMASANKEVGTMTTVLGVLIIIIGMGTLIAGIVGIANIMIFVVKERTKELGIRKALGATPKKVINSILFESIFITTISGFIGMIIGVMVLAQIGGKTLEDDYFITNPYIATGTAIFATILLVICGTIAGYIPARRAAKIKPIVALRDE